MPTINIEVKNKIAKSPLEHIVCGNSDYFIKFIFDSEWEEYRTKTARFEWSGQHYDQIFDGDICNIPVISDANVCAVGVFAGNLHTTTPALITCDKSILCNDSAPADPLPDVYNTLNEKLNALYDEISGANVSLGLKEAATGQIIKIKAVDGNGVPTEWEAADMPSGGGGIYGLLEQYDMFELAYGVLDSANLPARVVITEDSGGNAFDVDGIIVWTDIKSNVSYTSIAFNNRATAANPASHPYHYGLSHGVGSVFNLYLCGANNTFLQLLADGTLRFYKKQNKDVDGIDFNPVVNIQDVPSSITAICLSSQHIILSGTFYKVWGLKKKNV